MSLLPRTCRHLVKQQLCGTSPCIWISDEILSNAFHQFTTSKKSIRHGSSVPGPLEAKRRQSKRRMMNMASAGSDASVDGAAVLRMREPWSYKDLKWELPLQPGQLAQQAQSEEAVPAWPSWLENLRPHPTDDPSSEALKDPPRNIERPRTVIQNEAPMTLESELVLSRGLEGIRKAALHHACVISENQKHSELAFQSLLRKNPSLTSCIEFLEDSALNSPEAQNMCTLMSWEDLQAQPAQERKKLGLWIERQVADGQFSQRDIILVLKSVKRQGQVKPVLSSRKFAWGFCMRVWAGIQASAVNNISDLHIKAIRELLESASLNPVLEDAREFGRRILLSVQPTTLKELSLSVLSLVDRLSTYRFTSGQKAIKSFEWFSPVLRSLPEAEASRIATMISRRMTQRACKHGTEFSNQLESWFTALPQHVFEAARNDVEWVEEWLLIERDLVSLDLKTLASYLLLRVDPDVFTFILTSWLPRRFVSSSTGEHLDFPSPRRSKRNTFSHTAWTHLVRDIEQESCYLDGGGTTSAYLDLVHKLHKTYPIFFGATISDLLTLLHELDKHDAARCIAQYLSHHPTRVDSTILASQITRYMTTDLPFALQLFKADSRLRLEDCPGLAERLIAASPHASTEVLPLLQRDPHILGSLSSRAHPTHLTPVNTKRIALLHSIALAYAQAPHLTPRQAYRRVRRMLDAFRDRPDLVRPDMSKALTRAGILRYLEAGMWVSTVRLHYIVGYVRALEGELVVEALGRVVWAWRGRNLHLAQAVDKRGEDAEMD